MVALSKGQGLLHAFKDFIRRHVSISYKKLSDGLDHSLPTPSSPAKSRVLMGAWAKALSVGPPETAKATKEIKR